LAEFNAAIHTNDPAQPDQAAASWTRDLLTRPHPTFRADLFTVVDEAASGRIVSSLNLIPQTWSFGGIELGVGRIELVGTDPDFRRRGLVRRQMEVVHRWSEGMGHHAQGITGIPWYYRQFGYEMALDLGGDRRVALGDVPKPTAAGDEPYRLRPATAADAPRLMEADARGRSGRFVPACGTRRCGATRSMAETLPVDARVPMSSSGSLPPRRARVRGRTSSGDTSCGPRRGTAPARPGSRLPAILGPCATWIGYAANTTGGERGEGDPARACERDAAVFGSAAEHPLYRASPDTLRAAGNPTRGICGSRSAGFPHHVAPVLDDRLAASAARLERRLRSLLTGRLA
jgi:GNAT superfamily N-acetyltransferase